MKCFKNINTKSRLILRFNRIYNMTQKKLRISRSSTKVDQFITVQLHNQGSRRQSRNRKDSILNEINLTGSIIDQVINKKVKSSFHHEKIKQQKERIRRTKENWQNKQQPPAQKKKQIKMSRQIEHKFAQIKIISKFFQKACRRVDRNDNNIVLQTSFQDRARPTHRPSIVQKLRRRSSDVKNEQLIYELKHKIQQKKNQFETKKQQSNQRVRCNGYRIKKKFRSSKPCIDLDFTKPMVNFRDKYFQPFLKNNFLNKTFDTKNSKQNDAESSEKNRNWITNEQMYSQNAKKLKQFIEGGYVKEANQYSDYIKISQFNQSRQQFKSLDNVYKNLRRNNSLELRDLKIDDFSEPNLLTVMYYIQNYNNLCETDKKKIRNKFKILD